MPVEGAAAATGEWGLRHVPRRQLGHDVTPLLSALAHEQWPDDDRRGVLHRQTDDLSARLKAYGRMKEIDGRRREQQTVRG